MKATFALALLLSCFTGFLMAGDSKQAMEIFTGCMAENGVSDQDIADLKSGKVKTEDAKDNVKCATQCAFVKFGFMDDNGKLLNDNIMAHFTEPSMKTKVQTALTTCGSTVGASPCDTAFQMLTCFEKHAAAMM